MAVISQICISVTVGTHFLHFSLSTMSYILCHKVSDELNLVSVTRGIYDPYWDGDVGSYREELNILYSNDVPIAFLHINEYPNPDHPTITFYTRRSLAHEERQAITTLYRCIQEKEIEGMQFDLEFNSAIENFVQPVWIEDPEQQRTIKEYEEEYQWRQWSFWRSVMRFFWQYSLYQIQWFVGHRYRKLKWLVKATFHRF